MDTLITEYCTFFYTTLGFTPYPYQIRIAEAIFNGKNILLKASTGSGKTAAVVLPYIFLQQKQLSIGDRLIYSVPLQTLSLGIYQELKKVIPDDRIVFHNGNHSVDPFFEKEIIVTTIDQTLAAYLGVPYGCRKSQSNITRGALLGSYLIFDEFHLYDLQKLGLTSFHLVNTFKDWSRFVFMTATISSYALYHLQQILPNLEIIEPTPNELIQINQNRFKSIECIPTSFNIPHICSSPGKKIIICNTVQVAQNVYTDISQTFAGQNTPEILLLHSQFDQWDRKQMESQINGLFGKDSGQNNAILIATQTIEAGLNISCDMMFTEIAPLNSLLQRFGRCARFSNERGKIIIYNMYNLHEQTVYPYVDYSDVILQTWNELQQLTSLTLEQENQLIETIYTDFDKQEYQKFDQINLQNDLKSKLFEYDLHLREQYIRKIESKNVCVLSIPDDVHEFISVSNLENKLKKSKYVDGALIGWVKIEDDEPALHYKEPEYFPITSLKELKNVYEIILSPSVASYTSQKGLFFIPNEGTSSHLKSYNRNRIHVKYDCESFLHHANQCALQLSRFSNSHTWKQFVEMYPSFENAMKYMCKLHDIGKTNKLCQKHLHETQHKNDPTSIKYKPGMILAHSTFDSMNPNHIYSKNPVTHSYESAFLASMYLNPDIISSNLYLAIIYSIAKHHTNNSKFALDNISEIVLPKPIEKIVTEFRLPFNSILTYSTGQIHAYLKKIYFDYDEHKTELIYIISYMQRVLRLSDIYSLQNV